MRLKDYKTGLLEKLKKPEFAAAYLTQTLAEKDPQAFLIALRDVVEAAGGVSSLAQEVKLKRGSLYKILSAKGNPTVVTLQQLLEPLGLRMAVDLAKAA
ncbi:MAG: putative addiction module antidote protein [Verrucomicrobia bacterium]|nr:putative addiction module antidote protein [Verrucomicrobiota bacterium]